MFDWIDAFSNIHPLLPPIVRFGISVLIIIAALIPVSVIALILESAARNPFERLLSYLKTTGAGLYSSISIEVDRCAAIVDSFISNNRVSYGFNPSFKDTETAKAQKAIDDIEEHGRSFPDIIASRQAFQKDRYEDFEDRLNQIEAMRAEVPNLEIPDVRILEKDQEERTKGATKLFVFLPLSILTIIINTYLLNMFFSELLQDVERISKTLGLYVSHLISFMFSAVEIGIGAAIAFSGSDEENERTNHLLLTFLGWLVLVLLIFVEFAIYFLLSHGSGMVDILAGDMSLAELLLRGWMGIFGPIIVISLFMFGHWTAKGYLQFRSLSNLLKLKKEFDIAHEKSTAIDVALNSYNENLTSSLQELREHREITRTAPDSPLPEATFLEDLGSKISAARELLDHFSKIDSPETTTVVTELDQSAVKKIFYQMIFYAGLLLAAIIAATFVMVPLLNKHPEIQSLPQYAIVCIPILGVLAMAGIGYLWSMQFVMQIGNDITAHPRSIFIRVILALTTLSMLALAIYIGGVFPTPPTYASLIIIIMSMGTALWIGPFLLIVIDAMITVARLIGRYAILVVRWITAVVLTATFYLMTWIQALLEILAFPGRRLYQLIAG